ncbi:MAG: hypothetical protein DRJ35_03940 [Thermoprotei archaeon]|nr:MAG: hypothetical protein DRJ35_03940 [Thermoprotei archaeon]
MKKIYLTLAKILAKESVFRASKRNIKVPFISRDYTKVSALSSNLLPGIFFLLFASVHSILIISVTVEELPSILLPTLFMVAYFNLIQMLSFSSIFFGDELFEPVKIMPLNSKDIVKTYFVAYLLYWGGASTIMLFLPQFLIGAIFRLDALPFLIAFLYSSVAVMSSSILVAVYIGTYTEVFRKNILMNILSAIGWLILISSYYLMSYIPAIANYGKMIPREYMSFIALIPFIGPLYIGLYPLESIISIILTGVLVYSVYFKTYNCVETVIAGTRISHLPFLARRIEERKIKYRRLSRHLSLVRKDFKLILREPRRLSGILYLLLFPIFFIGFRTVDENMIFIFLSFVGSIIGISSTTWIYLEGEGAKVLYYLPLKRTDIYIAKILDSLVVLFFAVIFFVFLEIIGFATMSLYGIAAMVSNFTLLSTTTLAIIIANLPEHPSSWTESSINRFAIILLEILLTIGSMAIPIVFSLLYGIIVATIASIIMGVIGAIISFLYVDAKNNYLLIRLKIVLISLINPLCLNFFTLSSTSSIGISTLLAISSIVV